jgi:UDP-glucuronate 4-epimerase
MKILITGSAGFIGFHLAKQLINLKFEVVGLDNINDYYDINLKYDRLNQLGIKKSGSNKKLNLCSSEKFKNFKFIRMDLENKIELDKLFANQKFDIVCNLAAQAGVRYSIENPEAYIQSNIVGFLNILECSRHNNIKHLVYASSSSVYGSNKKFPFSVTDSVDNPISLYAATKKSNELMAHTYSHLYNLPTTGLRFFTVYGPWGRPDMALFLFTKGILNDEPINIYNNGDMLRDFTYVDDIVEGLIRIISNKNASSYKIYNIGNNNTVKLLDFINEIERILNKKAIKKFMPIQPGDVKKTLADVKDLMSDYNYKPSVKYQDGIQKFIEWYLTYYKIKNIEK